MCQDERFYLFDDLNRYAKALDYIILKTVELEKIFILNDGQELVQKVYEFYMALPDVKDFSKFKHLKHQLSLLIIELMVSRIDKQHFLEIIHDIHADLVETRSHINL